MGKLSIVTENNPNSDITINSVEKKIYCNNTDLVEGSLRFRPLRCSELHTRLAKRNWNKSETLFISEVDGEVNEDIPVLRYKKYNDLSLSLATGEIDNIDTRDTELSFPLCGEINDRAKDVIDREYKLKIGDDIDPLLELSQMKSAKTIRDLSLTENSIDLIKGLDSYTNSVSLKELIEYSSTPNLTGKVDLSIQYSKKVGGTYKIYNYDTSFCAFKYNDNRNLDIENSIEIIEDGGENLIQLEYLSGVIKVLPLSTKITECIINNCTIIYGQLR